MKKTVVLLILHFLVLSFSPSVWAGDKSSADPSMKDKVEAAIWIRPLGVFRVVLEAAAFGISYPVMRHLKKVKEVSDFFLKDPQSSTFERPLGEM